MKSEIKIEIIRLLKDALLAEERAVPIYNKHLESAVFWTGISEDKANKARSALQVLSSESLRHRMIVEKILLDLSKK